MTKTEQSNSTREVPKEGVMETIGSTPLICLRRYLETADVQLYAKMEAFNPGGERQRSSRPHHDRRSAGVRHD